MTLQKEAYVVYAHAVLPAIVPLGFTLLEPDRSRARLMWPLVCLGLLLGVYLLWQVTAYPVGAQPQARCIDYTTHTPNDVLIGVFYVRCDMRAGLDVQPSLPPLVRADQPRRRDRGRARASQ